MNMGELFKKALRQDAFEKPLKPLDYFMILWYNDPILIKKDYL